MEQLSLFDAPIPVARPNPALRTTTAEVRAVRSAGETLRAAGWRRVPGDALGLTWRVDDYEIEFHDLAELDAAASLLTATPGLTIAALVTALGERQ